MKLAQTMFALLFFCGTHAFAGPIKPYQQSDFDRLAKTGQPILIAVHADWCPTCRAQKPIIEAAMRQAAYKDVTTLVIDFDTDKPLLRTYRVAMQSTLIAFKGAQEVGRTVGDTTPAGIAGLIDKTQH